MQNNEPRRTRSQKIWQVVVGLLLGLFVVDLLGISLIRFVQIARGQFAIERLIYFSSGEKLFLVVLPAVPAAMLLRKRPLISLGMLFSAAMVWMIVGWR
jgi:hypothetical protein